VCFTQRLAYIELQAAAQKKSQPEKTPITNTKPQHATDLSTVDKRRLVETAAYPLHMVPNLGVNYPNWVMGPFDLGNWQFLFSIRPESKNWHGKNRPNRRIN